MSLFDCSIIQNVNWHFGSTRGWVTQKTYWQNANRLFEFRIAMSICDKKGKWENIMIGKMLF
jgi:hypothetical protein